MLSWTSTDATSCVASDGWSGSKLVWSIESMSNLTATRSYTLTCTGPGGSASATATIGVDEPAPTLTLTAEPATVILGQSATLTWSGANLTSCLASGGWTGARAGTGAEVLVKPATTQAYTLNCTGLGGTVRRTASVDVFPPPEAPAYVLASVGDGSTTLLWGTHAGSSYAGQLVSTNVYVSTRPGIRPATFVESPTDQVKRGLDRASTVFSGFANGTPLYVVATDVAGGIEGPPSVEITVTPQPIPPLVERMDALNDTGVTGCTDLVLASIPCSQVTPLSQDGEVGRDAAAAAGTLAKVGFGRAGFDFTKLDASGAPLPSSAAAWPCVRDNVTGLTWQVPTDSGLTAYTNVYSWYHPDPLVHQGFAGPANSGVCQGSRCDTEAYIRALNDAAWCGFRDWRLPTRRELFSLASFEPLSRPLDPQVFPRQPSTFNAFYWTSTTWSLGLMAWAMYVDVPGLVRVNKSPIGPGDYTLGYVLAVR